MLDEIQVNKVLDLVRPIMQRDGGDVTLVKIENESVYIRLIGACAGCPISFITVTHGIQEALQKEFSFLKEVIVLKD